MSTSRELPPLPEPALTPPPERWPYAPHFTAEQMHAYGQVCYAAGEQDLTTAYMVGFQKGKQAAAFAATAAVDAAIRNAYPAAFNQEQSK
jgi:hypothetical protein